MIKKSAFRCTFCVYSHVLGVFCCNFAGEIVYWENSPHLKGPENIFELVERMTNRAKRLPKEQAQAVASCLEHALRGSQDDDLYKMIDSIYEHTSQAPQPLVQIGEMKGNINAIEPKNNDDSD